MLTFVLRKKWFHMISSGEKKEKYCEINPYYTSKFRKIVLKNTGNFKEIGKKDLSLGTIRFKYRHRIYTPVIYAECYLTIGTGRKEWGAKEGKKYYILKIKNPWDATFVDGYQRGLYVAIFITALSVIFSEISKRCREIFQYFLKKSKNEE